MNGLTVNLHLLMVRLLSVAKTLQEVAAAPRLILCLLSRSCPSTNPQRLGTKSSWRPRPSLQTT